MSSIPSLLEDESIGEFLHIDSPSSSSSDLELGTRMALESSKSNKMSGKFGRGGYSRDSMDSEQSGEFANYHVHFPPTPDNQPMEEVYAATSINSKAEEEYVKSSIFTGGYNNETRAHVLDTVLESDKDEGAPKTPMTCSVEGCDEKVMTDKHGNRVFPCECNFKICTGCFMDAANKQGTGNCPGCKEHYVTTDLNELLSWVNGKGTTPLSLPPPERPDNHKRLSMMKSEGNRNNNQDFDHNKWLFETNATYGYGNAIWPEENGDEDGRGDNGRRSDLTAKAWQPLTRKLSIPAAVLSPYRSKFTFDCLFDFR